MLRATAPCWFPPGYPEAKKVAEELALEAPELLLPSRQPARNFGLWVPQMYNQASALVGIQAEPQNSGPAVAPEWPKMVTEAWYFPAQRGSACRLPAAPRLTERPPQSASQPPGRGRGSPTFPALAWTQVPQMPREPWWPAATNAPMAPRSAHSHGRRTTGQGWHTRPPPPTALSQSSIVHPYGV